MKKTILILVTTIASLSAISQDYFHKLGVSWNVYGDKTVYDVSGETENLDVRFMPMVTYQAGFDFEIGDILYFSPTAYPALGSGIITVNGAGGSDILAFNLPVVAELYIGEDREYFGGFIGAGFEYSWYSSLGSIMGPQFSGGLNFNFGDTFLGNYFGDSPVSLRFAYTIPINKPSYEIEPNTGTSFEFMPIFHVQFLYGLGM